MCYKRGNPGPCGGSTSPNYTLNVVGCNYLPLPGATVTVTKGTTTYTATTNGSGQASFVLGVVGVWSVSVSYSTGVFASGSDTVNVTSLSAMYSSYLQLLPASTYVCTPCNVIPWPTTLHLSENLTLGGIGISTDTLTYYSSPPYPFLGIGWFGSGRWTADLFGNGTTVTFGYRLFCDGSHVSMRYIVYSGFAYSGTPYDMANYGIVGPTFTGFTSYPFYTSGSFTIGTITVSA